MLAAVLLITMMDEPLVREGFTSLLKSDYLMTFYCATCSARDDTFKERVSLKCNDFLDVCCVARELAHFCALPFISVMQNVAKKLASFPALEK